MQIDRERMQKGDTVWYRWSQQSEVYGPYTVKKVFGAHDGTHVILKSVYKSDERQLLLADDEDFGALLFYDANPDQPNGPTPHTGG